MSSTKIKSGGRQGNRIMVKKRSSRIAPRRMEKIMELSLIRTYPNQVCWETWLPGTPLEIVTTVTTGLIAAAFAVNSSEIASFATRFGSTFIEYRIIRAKYSIRFFSTTNPGVIQVWYDEQSSSAPTLAEAQERYIASLSVSAVEDKPTYTWVCADPADLAYRPIGTAYTPATFKVFTNSANFGSSAVVTGYGEVIPHYQLQFRGLVGV